MHLLFVLHSLYKKQTVICPLVNVIIKTILHIMFLSKTIVLLIEKLR